MNQYYFLIFTTDFYTFNQDSAVIIQQKMQLSAKPTIWLRQHIRNSSEYKFIAWQIR